MTEALAPHIAALSRAAAHSFSKQPVAELTCIAGEGIEGDAHRGRTTQHVYRMRRTPQLANLCQVHLLAAERLEQWAAAGFALGPGDFGENLLTRGVDLHALPLATRIHAGNEVVLEVTGERTPCSQIDAFRPGLQALCWQGAPPPGKRLRRAGIMATVLRGGALYSGDPLRFVPPSGAPRPLPAV